jgi:hypothetical protein
MLHNLVSVLSGSVAVRMWTLNVKYLEPVLMQTSFELSLLLAKAWQLDSAKGRRC